jgi:hypothetical protein
MRAPAPAPVFYHMVRVSDLIGHSVDSIDWEINTPVHS